MALGFWVFFRHFLGWSLLDVQVHYAKAADYANPARSAPEILQISKSSR
jgi:hypothetical protein